MHELTEIQELTIKQSFANERKLDEIKLSKEFDDYDFNLEDDE